jgi:hypothetical protein
MGRPCGERHGQASLPVHVHHQHALAVFVRGIGQVRGQRALANATFLVSGHQNFHALTPVDLDVRTN